jgi:Dit-like phage tail protein
MSGRAIVLPRLCKIDAITIDVCRDETHTLTNQVTDHPVEEGFNISDHSRPEPDTVTLSCFVSNTPLSLQQQTRAVQEGSVSFNTTSQQAVAIGAVNGRADDTFKKLKKLRDEGTLIAVVTTLRTYGLTSTQGMAIQSLSISRTSKNYDGLEFVVTLRQIRIVKNKQTTDRQSKDRRVPKKKNKGAQTPKTDEVETSAALKLTESQTAKDMAKSDNPVIGGLGRFITGAGAGPQ